MTRQVTRIGNQQAIPLRRQREKRKTTDRKRRRHALKCREGIVEISVPRGKDESSRTGWMGGRCRGKVIAARTHRTVMLRMRVERLGLGAKSAKRGAPRSRMALEVACVECLVVWGIR